MFGRISSKNIHDRHYCYYIPGVLDNVQYFKIYDGRLFLNKIDDVDFDSVMCLCETWSITEAEKPDECIHMRTARERIKFRTSDRGTIVNGI
jgi:hypothetical protein